MAGMPRHGKYLGCFKIEKKSNNSQFRKMVYFLASTAAQNETSFPEIGREKEKEITENQGGPDGHNP